MSSIFCKFFLTIYGMKNRFAERLTELLEINGLSKRMFADKIGVSAMSVSDWTNRNVQPTAENIFLSAEFFKISADFLLGLEDDAGAKLY